MEIVKTKQDHKLTMEIKGRLDTLTSTTLQKEFDESTDGITELILDMKELVYTSSAGLRVLLNAQKAMNKVGTMKLINVSDDVLDVFEITGFLDILTIE